MKNHLLLFILSFNLSAFGQPGGGGGMGIGGYYDETGRCLHCDKELEVRIFNILNEMAVSENFESTLFSLENSHSYRPSASSNQRLLICWRKDTMVVDMLGIVDENPMGYSESVERIIFKPGYYSCDSDFNSEDQRHLKWVSNNFPKFPPLPDSIPASYYRERGIGFEDLDLFDFAIQDYHQSKEYIHLFWLYDRLNQPDSAIKYISNLIDDPTNPSRSIMASFRGKVFEKQGRIKEAVNDYETYCFDPNVRFQGDREILHAETLRFYQLNDSLGAIKKLKQALDIVPEYSPQHGNHYGTSKHILYTLAKFEMQLGWKEEAFKHLRMHFERNAGNGNYDDPSIPEYVDSLIRIYKNNPDLTFAKAIARMNYRKTRYENPLDDYFEALKILSKAKKLGFPAYKFYFIQAKLYRQISYQKEVYMNKAIEAVNKSISLEPDFPFSYLDRGEYMSHSGTRFTDEDIKKNWQKFTELIPKWKFETY